MRRLILVTSLTVVSASALRGQSDARALGPSGAPGWPVGAIVGLVVDSATGAPVPGAVVEIWQCDAFGRYRHPRDRQDGRDPGFQGRGRAVAGPSDVVVTPGWLWSVAATVSLSRRSSSAPETTRVGRSAVAAFQPRGQVTVAETGMRRVNHPAG